MSGNIVESMPSRLTAEDIDRILSERPGGRKAGGGDSPYTQEFYERTYGLKDYAAEIKMKEDSGDELMTEILSGNEYSDFAWYLKGGESQMRPLVRRYGLLRELRTVAACNAYLSWEYGQYGNSRSREEWALMKAVEEGLDSDYDRIAVFPNAEPMDKREYRLLMSQAKRRVDGFMERCSRYTDYGKGGLRKVAERVFLFRTVYLCLCTDGPLKMQDYLCTLEDSYKAFLSRQ